MASCVAIRWPPNGQRAKCVPNMSNPCPHSHVRRLDVKGWIKPRWKHNNEVKIRCVMRNEQINGLATNHSLAPLSKQEWMRALDVKEMESSSKKIDLGDVLWWKTIKDVYNRGALIIAKLSKRRCISPTIKFCVTRKQDWSKWGAPSTWETYSSKTGLSKIRNLEYKYRITKTQLPKKIDGAQSSVKRRPIPPKDIGNQVWHLTKGP
jgi:hypothetical protein